jgi:hypothetical protein
VRRAKLTEHSVDHNLQLDLVFRVFSGRAVLHPHAGPVDAVEFGIVEVSVDGLPRFVENLETLLPRDLCGRVRRRSLRQTHRITHSTDENGRRRSPKCHLRPPYLRPSRKEEAFREGLTIRPHGDPVGIVLAAALGNRAANVSRFVRSSRLSRHSADGHRQDSSRRRA